ncbi:secondary thiamine-phosphate synthase enzyme YjbQ [Anaeromyxobacter diazotrophicus]|nr:secondary thiamine-phosphate synthase enzyme YjbQ [Anaeromyxobacter diazotrophicus]
MRSQTLEIATRARCELVELTGQVRAAVARAGLAAGAVLVYSPHTTAGVTIQENADPDVRRDLLLALENAVPDAAPRGAYRHGEGNSPAHVKTALLGASQLVPVEGGELQLGTWQGVFLVELDGPRRRQVLLRFLADAP